MKEARHGTCRTAERTLCGTIKGAETLDALERMLSGAVLHHLCRLTYLEIVLVDLAILAERVGNRQMVRLVGKDKRAKNGNILYHPSSTSSISYIRKGMHSGSRGSSLCVFCFFFFSILRTPIVHRGPNGLTRSLSLAHSCQVNWRERNPPFSHCTIDPTVYEPDDARRQSHDSSSSEWPCRRC